jgi:hypothetical protein
LLIIDNAEGTIFLERGSPYYSERFLNFQVITPIGKMETGMFKEMAIVTGIYLAIGAFFCANVRKEGEPTFIERQEQRIARTAELSHLVDKALQKAEMTDGERGLSLHDSAEMAYALGDTRTIKEGEPVALFVEEVGLSGNPQVYFNIGNYRNKTPIREDKLRTYVGE